MASAARMASTRPRRNPLLTSKQPRVGILTNVFDNRGQYIYTRYSSGLSYTSPMDIISSFGPKYFNKWVALSMDRTRILSSGKNNTKEKAAVLSSGAPYSPIEAYRI